MKNSVSILRSVYIFFLQRYGFNHYRATNWGLKVPNGSPPLALRQRVKGTAELVAHDARHVVFQYLDADVPRLVEPRPALS